MIIYNVTLKVELGIHDAWLRWMREKHLDEVLATGCFTQHKFYRLLQEDETDGITYCAQYFANSLSDYFDYRDRFAAALQKDAKDKWGDRFVAFRSLLKEV